jgi:hypothetical protein
MQADLAVGPEQLVVSVWAVTVRLGAPYFASQLTIAKLQFPQDSSKSIYEWQQSSSHSNGTTSPQTAFSPNG